MEHTGYRIIIDIPAREGEERAKSIARSLVLDRGSLVAKVYQMPAVPVRHVNPLLLSSFDSSGIEHD